MGQLDSGLVQGPHHKKDSYVAQSMGSSSSTSALVAASAAAAAAAAAASAQAVAAQVEFDKQTLKSGLSHFSSRVETRRFQATG
jgi:pyocin large subunit-like protein